MDPIMLAIQALRAVGVDVERTPEPWLEAYTATGYPELTRNQIFDLAHRLAPSRGIPRP